MTTYTTGKGLGKNETGIAHSIKVPLKTDTSGVWSACVFTLLYHHSPQVGFNPNEDFTNHRWTKKFNETAKSINVEHEKVLE